jgi:NADH-quinone oxidoreductase subunit C/D
LELTVQPTADGVPTVWVAAEHVRDVLAAAHGECMETLYDLTAIDERMRTIRPGQPAGDFTVVYHLISPTHGCELRLKVPLRGEHPSIRTITDIWASADWYERELWDMFGITVEGHPRLERILLPSWWEGHPLRKEYPCRATERGPFAMDDARREAQEQAMRFDPAAYGWARHTEEFDYMFLNMGPHHPSTHGVYRVVLQLDGQEIHDVATEIGFHHRGAEKMGERQSWHTYIPYTDRVDYLQGVMNNFPYVLAVEALAGITVPDRAKVVRILLAECFRIISHLVYLGTFAQDLGMMSPVFYLFTDRERAFEIIEAVTGARMHPAFFRIGGVALDLPDGWEPQVRAFIAYMEKRLVEIETGVLANRIFRLRTEGIGVLVPEVALAWGVTGPMLRASGIPWDLRKTRPYGGYEQFDFDVPTACNGDCYDRAAVHVEEMRQSLRIMTQCCNTMPGGPVKADHPLTTPPPKARTLHDIETLIDHFLNVTWGPVIPAGEACASVEATKGNNSYYLVSDGNTVSYRTRIRTPSFAHLQLVPQLARGFSISDLVAILGSIDFVMADVDR